MSGANGGAGKVFISYARDEDSHRVDTLYKALEAAGIPVWRDTDMLGPGDEWPRTIPKAIEDAPAFIACFSRASVDRPRSYQNEEIILAIEEFRKRRTDKTWFIPVRFDDCRIPDCDLGAGRTLAKIQCVDVFDHETDADIDRLVDKVREILGCREGGERTASGSPPYPSAPLVPAGYPDGGPGTLPVSKHDAPRGGLDVEDPPRVAAPPMKPSPSVNRVRKGRGIAAAVIGTVCAVIVISLLFSALPDGPHATPKASKAQVPRGCPAQLGGLNNNEPIGFVDSSCFPHDPDMAKVTSDIEAENAKVVSGTPYRTVVFFGVMSSSGEDASNPASLFQLRGVLFAQHQQNKEHPKFKIRVLLANAADFFKAGPAVAQQISDRVRTDSSIVAVLGIGQSRTYSLNAIHELSSLSLPVIGTSVTAGQMIASADPNFFRISPGNERQAQLAAAFARHDLNARHVLILANLKNDTNDGNVDYFSQDLTNQFEHYFSDTTHTIIDICHYGELVENVDVSCRSKTKTTLTIPQLRELICQEKPDLIFFAARAVTLQDLFISKDGCNHLPAVLGTSDVPKYVNSTKLLKKIATFGSQIYYLSFAPAKQAGCSPNGGHEDYQTPVMCDFLGAYRNRYPTTQGTTENNVKLSFDSSDAMLGYDALQTIIQAIDVTGPGVSGARMLGELNSGRIAFNGASGLIRFPAHDHTPPDHPVYLTSLGGTLTLQISCGKFSDAKPQKDAPPENIDCPTVQ